MKSIPIGNLHPSYFYISPIFRNFDKVKIEGGILLKSSIMSLTFKEGSLFCEDEGVLEDFNKLIFENYGSELTWNEAYQMIDWSTVPKHVKVVNFGNVFLDDDSDSGWDGAVNSIWYDNSVPGKVIKIFHRIWANNKICDCYKMKLEDLKDMERDEVMKNLVMAKLYKVEGVENKALVDELIKEYLRALPR